MDKCINCESENISHEEKRGRGIPPKGKKKHPNRKTSYTGIWDIYTCEECGHIKKQLRK